MADTLETRRKTLQNVKDTLVFYKPRHVMIPNLKKKLRSPWFIQK